MRYFMIFTYDGSKFSGYQKQFNCRTVQGELERILTMINGNKKVLISASGRTDTGVHALNQTAHFDLDKDINLEKLKHSLNSLLPNDIYVKKIEKVDDYFHARFKLKAQECIYIINVREYNPIEFNYVYQLNHNLNIEAMSEALGYLEGKHNFKSFTPSADLRQDYIRTIIKTRISIMDNKITISLLGTGFMRYMVRNIVGLLIEIGEEKRKASDIITILEAQDRTKAGKTAPANGLYLKNVFY